MIDTVRDALESLGMDAQRIHIERYGAPRKAVPARKEAAPIDGDRLATVDVIMDGHKKSFDFTRGAGNLVDAAAEQGIDLPYSCKGGVCATCRTHVRDGEVEMATNYGLEPWEVEKGFVLACQSVPVSDRITIDYDKT
jgi:ring-1,2-phenylacetyl-CoA epoxidase subunit PaaE